MGPLSLHPNLSLRIGYDGSAFDGAYNARGLSYFFTWGGGHRGDASKSMLKALCYVQRRDGDMNRWRDPPASSYLALEGTGAASESLHESNDS